MRLSVTAQEFQQLWIIPKFVAVGISDMESSCRVVDWQPVCVGGGSCHVAHRSIQNSLPFSPRRRCVSQRSWQSEFDSTGEHFSSQPRSTRPRQRDFLLPVRDCSDDGMTSAWFGCTPRLHQRMMWYIAGTWPNKGAAPNRPCALRFMFAGHSFPFSALHHRRRAVGELGRSPDSSPFLRLRVGQPDEGENFGFGFHRARLAVTRKA